MSLDARLTATADGLLRSFEPRSEAAYAGTLVRARRRQQRNVALAAGFGAAAVLALSLFGTRISELVLGLEPPPLPPAREDTSENTNRHRNFEPRLEDELSIAVGGRSASGSSDHDYPSGGRNGIAAGSAVGSSSAATQLKSTQKPRIVEYRYTENADGIPGWEYEATARPGERWAEIWIEDDSSDEPIYLRVDVHKEPSTSYGGGAIYNGCRSIPRFSIPEGAHLLVGPWVRRRDGNAPNHFFDPSDDGCSSLPTSGTLFIAFYRSQPE